MKLISNNIEGHQHLEERVLPFLKQEQSDIVCLQEVFAVDVPLIEEKLGLRGQFTPMAQVVSTSYHMPLALGVIGLYVGTRMPEFTVDERYYQNENPEEVPEFFKDQNPNSLDRAVAWLTVTPETGAEVGLSYTVATTHFIWTEAGQVTPLQQSSLVKMQQILTTLPPHVLCGDFNAPRGRAVFDELAQEYTDNIPSTVTTTIDNQLHKSDDQIEFVVDGLFSHPQYHVSDVRVVSGVSDHKAVVAEILRQEV